MTGLRQRLLDAEARGWRELSARLDRLADDDWLRPGLKAGWTPKDLLAHLAVWHALTADRLEALRATGRLPPGPEDIDAFNAEQLERCRDLSLHDARVMSGAARHRFREEIDRLPDEPADPLPAIVSSNADGHYAEHIPQLDAFLGSGA